jgi:NADH-quinone oxidoreductase subunit N
MAICLFSLAGIPPTAGFFGKMFLVTAGAAKGNYVLVTVAAMNMVISLFYYLRVIKAIFIDDNDQPIEKLAGSISLRIALAICITGAITMGFASGMFDYINAITGK